MIVADHAVTGASATRPGGAGWRGHRFALGGGAVGALTLLLLVATEPHLAMVWDEGFTLGREARVGAWFRGVVDPAGFAASYQPPRPGSELVQDDGRPAPSAREVDARAKLFDPRVIAWFWPFAREEPHGHPPFYAIVGMLGEVVTPGRPPLARARLGPMVAWAITSGAIFASLGRRRGFWAGLAGSGAFVLQPRLFAHAHYALYDNILTCLWVGSILAFVAAVVPVEPAEPPRRRPRWGWAIGFGLLVGSALATKLTGWFLPLPFLAWTLTVAGEHRRAAAWTLAIGAAVAVVTVYLLVPPWWDNPVAGFERFLRSNLGRSRTTRIPTLFLGRVYLTPSGSLPWFNTLVWTAFVTPVGLLGLAMAGVVGAARTLRGGAIGLLAVGHWGFLLLLRALPHTPGHDAERQFLAAFGCLALVAGLGAGWVVDRFGRRGQVLVAASLAEAGLGIAMMMPVPLAYYSPIVGGPAGAARWGMEPTYYWDALADAPLAWLRDHTGPGEKVVFATYPTSWRYLVAVGKLPAGSASPRDPGRPAWYVLQNRPGAFRAIDRALVARIRADPTAGHVLIERFGVPLAWAFPGAEYRRALAQVGPINPADEVFGP